MTVLLRLELRSHLGLVLHRISKRGVVTENDETLARILKRFNHNMRFEMRRNAFLTQFCLNVRIVEFTDEGIRPRLRGVHGNVRETAVESLNLFRLGHD